MSVVRVGPFKRIVGVHWPGADIVTVDFRLVYYGPGTLVPCDEGETPPDVPGTFYDLWYTSVQLRNSKSQPQANGITAIAGDTDFGAWTVAGLPAYEEAAVGAMEVIAFNDTANLDNPLVSEDYRTQAMVFTPLDTPVEGFEKSPSIEFQLWNPKWNAGAYCDGTSHVKFRPTDNDGFVNFDNGHSFKAVSQTLDFSGFTITKIATGEVYQAVAARPLGAENGVDFTLLMMPATST